VEGAIDPGLGEDRDVSDGLGGQPRCYTLPEGRYGLLGCYGLAAVADSYGDILQANRYEARRGDALLNARKRRVGLTWNDEGTVLTARLEGAGRVLEVDAPTLAVPAEQEVRFGRTGVGATWFPQVGLYTDGTAPLAPAAGVVPANLQPGQLALEANPDDPLQRLPGNQGPGGGGSGPGRKQRGQRQGRGPERDGRGLGHLADGAATDVKPSRHARSAGRPQAGREGGTLGIWRCHTPRRGGPGVQHRHHA
jgi:hypothetical protein